MIAQGLRRHALTVPLHQAIQQTLTTMEGKSRVERR